MIEDWKNDYGYKPTFKIPPDIEAGKNKDCSKESFIKWAENQWHFRYSLQLRTPTSQINARWALDDKMLRSLEHGKTYTWKELNRNKKGKVQFIVEDLSKH